MSHHESRVPNSNDNSASDSGAAPGELREHELSHLGIFNTTLPDGRVVAHNVNGPNIVCPVCRGDLAVQANCSECAGRGMVGDVPYCPRPWDLIHASLFLGGHDNQPAGGPAHVGDEFDLVISLYQREGYGPADGIPHHTHTMVDGALDPIDHPHLDRLADHVVDAVRNGHRVLVRCQAGLNRSALVAGLALVKLGWTTDDILNRMRTVRSEYVLFNQHFVAHLRDRETALGVARPRCTPCGGRAELFGTACDDCGGTGAAPTDAQD